MYQNQHFNINNPDLLYIKAVYKHHSNEIKIDDSIAIVLLNLNKPHILPLFFK
jgi:hypothetical protein